MGKKPKAKTADAGRWKNRIVGAAIVHPLEITQQDANWRTHPAAQMRELNAVIGELGFIRSITVNQRTGRLVDGHARLALAIQSGQTEIPVEYVDLSEEEERQALLTLDPLAAMAGTNQQALEALIAQTQLNPASLSAILPSNQADQDGVEQVDIHPPPRHAWILIGVDLARYDEVASHVEALENVSGITVRTARD